VAPLEDIVQPTPLQPPRLSLLASVPVYEVILTDGGGESDTSTARTVSGDVWRTAALTFTPEPCGGEGGTYDPSCGPTTVDISGDKSTVKTPEHFHAFGVHEPESCSTFGYGGLDTDQRSQRALALDEAKQVEREFWKGTRAQAIGGAFLLNRWLARNVAEPITGNPPAVTQLKGGVAQNPTRALAELEQAIANGRSGGRCLIHASRRTVTYWTENGHLYRVGNLLLTMASDAIVVSGEGYDGSAPDGTLDATGDTAWAYATGPIEVFRGPVEMLRPNSPELTGSNRRTSIATRKYALEVDPCVYVGIKVTHP
jgi:hypothetical protein